MKHARSFLSVSAVSLSIFAGLAAAAAPEGKPAAPAPTPAAPTAPAAPAEKLPSVQEVMDRFIAATGGRAAHEKLTNRRMVTTIHGPMGKVTMTMTQARPARMIAKVEMGEMGEQSTGYADGVAWESSQINGPRLLDGGEKAMAARNAAFTPELDWAKLYPKSVVRGSRRAGPKGAEADAWVVELIAPEGQKVTQLYAKESGLLLATEMVMESAMGELAVTMAIKSWKDFDGIKMPAETAMTVMGMELKTTTDKVEHNVALAADAFEPPADIKELIARAKAKPAEANKPADAAQPGDAPKPANAPKP